MMDAKNTFFSHFDYKINGIIKKCFYTYLYKKHVYERRGSNRFKGIARTAIKPQETLKFSFIFVWYVIFNENGLIPSIELNTSLKKGAKHNTFQEFLLLGPCMVS